MASATHKVDKIRNRKKTASGARRKREIRHDVRVKQAAIAKAIGLDVEGQLGQPGGK
jgi:hypothetical protein